MKNKLFALFLLSGFVAIQAEAPLSTKEREKIMAETREEFFCDGILVNLYQTAERLNDDLTDRQLAVARKIKDLNETFNCKNFKEKTFKKLDVYVENFKIQEKILSKPIKDFSSEEFAQYTKNKNAFAIELQTTLSKKASLMKQLNLTEEEYNKMLFQWITEFNNLVEEKIKN